jgi:hypothetical protein
MLCDKYREQTALLLLIFPRRFNARSDFDRSAAMTERVSSYEEKYLTEDEISSGNVGGHII